MDISKIVVVEKLSRYEYDQRLYNLTGKETIEKWRSHGESEEKVAATLDSHNRQKESLAFARKLLPQSLFVSRDQITRELAHGSDLVVSLGGDDHLLYVAHFVNHTPLLGINSDPLTSNGKLLYFIAHDLESLVPRIEKNDVNYEFWTQLSGKACDGDKVVELPHAVSQYTIKTEDPDGMYRHIIEYRGEQEEQKGSGFIAATGTGSTGWYKGETKYVSPHAYKFPRTEKSARFALMAPWEPNDIPEGQVTSYKLYKGSLQPGEELSLTLLGHGQCRVTSDALDKRPLYRGNKVIIKLADTPLRMVKP